MFDRYSYIPLYAQLKNKLVEKIKNSTWQFGFKIQMEKELIEKYDIGRATVR
ncbi:MAG: GntR family transcriptional regulator [Caloramator sp.]|nr:GntR family transcriptional regulator [Caloramator sp.]